MILSTPPPILLKTLKHLKLGTFGRSLMTPKFTVKRERKCYVEMENVGEIS